MEKRTIRLSRKGIFLARVEAGSDDTKPKFDWTDALIDATIAAGVTFFTTLGALGVVGLLDDPQSALLASGIAAAGSFFAWLAMKRGVQVPPQVPPQ